MLLTASRSPENSVSCHKLGHFHSKAGDWSQLSPSGAARRDSELLRFSQIMRWLRLLLGCSSGTAQLTPLLFLDKLLSDSSLEDVALNLQDLALSAH